MSTLLIQWFFSICLIAYLTADSSGQVRDLPPLRIKPGQILIERIGQPQVVGELSDFMAKGIVMFPETYNPYLYKYSNDIHWPIMIPVDEIQAIRYPKNRIASAAAGMLAGLLIGSIAKPSGATGLLVGAAIGTGVGIGVSFVIYPNKMVIRGKHRRYQAFLRRLDSYERWDDSLLDAGKWMILHGHLE